MAWHDPVDSDKHYWHRYSEFYRRHLSTLEPVNAALEYGMLHGASVRWLHGVFPDAAIIGVDIERARPDWPSGPGISYVVANQGNRASLARMLQGLNRRLDLVIDDGSHMPRHQANCLVETLPFLRPGGLYILEDLQTSHPRHPYYKSEHQPGTPTSLHLLLFIERALAGSRVIDDAGLHALSHPDLFSPADVELLVAGIASVDIFHRATLPLRCYNCGGEDFDPVALACRCGVSFDIMDLDSITAVLRAR